MSRQSLIALAAVVAVVLVAAFAWLPLERSRARLAAQLPALRASVATLERDAEEAKRLRSLPAPAPRATEPLASLVTSAGGKTLPGARITVLDGRRLALDGANVDFGALVDWIASAHAAQGLRVESARIEALPAAGRVRAELRLGRD